MSTKKEKQAVSGKMPWYKTLAWSTRSVSLACNIMVVTCILGSHNDKILRRRINTCFAQNRLVSKHTVITINANTDKSHYNRIYAYSRHVLPRIQVVSYLTYYCTNILAMPATIVGTLLLVSKLFDGVMDIIAGFIVDNTQTRFGKARPYEICIIFVWPTTLLMYSCPDLGMTGKVFWVFTTYILVNIDIPDVTPQEPGENEIDDEERQ